MTIKISKWGNSQGLRVPKDVMEQLNLHIGDSVSVAIEDGKVVLEPMNAPVYEYDLDELLAKMPSEVTTKEEWQGSVGNEAW